MLSTTATPAIPVSPIPTYHIGHDQVVLLPDGHSALVTSKSEQGCWRLVVDHRCECAGYAGVPGTDFAGRGHCRHVDAVAEVEAMVSALVELVVLPRPVPTATVTPVTPITAKAVNGGYCVECDCERQMPGSTRCRYCHEREERRAASGSVR